MSEALERRYKRLLAWYPASHRARYEQEMLGVLMEGAGPERTHPTLSEWFDLGRGALLARLRTTGSALADPRWQDAATVVALTGLLFFLERAAESLLWPPDVGLDHAIRILVSAGIQAAPPVGATIALLAGWRRVAAGLGWVLVLLTLPMHFPPAGSDFWMAVLAVVVAAGLTVSASPRRAVRILGPWRLSAMALAIGTQIAEFVPTGNARRIAAILELPLFGSRPAWVFVALVGPAVCGVVLLTLAAPVRRRALALLCAPAVTFAMQAEVLPYRFSGSVLFLLGNHLPESFVAAALLGIPALGFVFALLVVHLREQATQPL
jgi:hypothetical protein